jgi:hypothetical protein
MAADAWCGRGSRTVTVRARSRGDNGEAVGLLVAVHASGDQTRLGFLSGDGHPWDAYLLYAYGSSGPLPRELESPRSGHEKRGSPTLGLEPIQIEQGWQFRYGYPT